MEIKIVKDKISQDELEKIAQEGFGDMIKAVVDIEKEIVAAGGELHSDANELLIKNGSKQKNLWGINIYPARPKEQKMDFFAYINIRPLANNRSMEIQDPEIRGKIKQIIDKLLIE